MADRAWASVTYTRSLGESLEVESKLRRLETAVCQVPARLALGQVTSARTAARVP